MRAYRPGDVLLTTKLGLPAIWWYGGVPISGAGLDGSRQRDGGPILRLAYLPPGPDCPRDDLRQPLIDKPRVLVNFGFRFDDVPHGGDDLLLDRLTELGQITQDRRFSEVGRVTIVDLRFPPEPRDGSSRSGAESPRASLRPAGCIAVGPGTAW